MGGVVQHGYAPYYSRGGMEVVSRNRDLPFVGCMVSSPVYDVGEWVVIYGVNTDRALRCRITDVSDPTVKCNAAGRCESDQQRHIRTKRVTELSYEAALALCGARAMRELPEGCPIIVFRF